MSLFMAKIVAYEEHNPVIHAKSTLFFIDKYITHMIQTGYTKHYYAGTERLNGYIVKVNNKAHKILNL